ncbi:TPA: Lrp/AsnC family transcriptional regulator [Pseudomonas aeruginosa]|uniref:Siroheme decarboxylase NirL subunit n=1 Tax=Pseudomonas aeruginosa TaxID=287 RepID=A0A5E5R6A0_PSEAI|nr:Lrp/AsnC family transcriptional regulator [Pseudomonas aeruginosa]MBG5705534.1 Lrp/AsnC family transcriptional regulator [Pseudomonas aeruginosa]VVH82954.1 hypothetical protein TUEID40_04142 [Pseudomonas aeruginosa]HBN8045690.1 Lrp/AsnC family transcriptional regulator [Pseudomonas aeruginosa]HCF2406733.1 Lrp/AsnC family transcriptional regulator [Pseudomonas aeruginosa]HCK0510222.1 Lrp/AsnC family transcriptional regulator [Pseudomonas aeruginosa]
MNPVEPLAAPQRQHLRYLLEQGLPLASRPYRVLAERIGAGEDEVLEQVRRWDEDGLFRRFGVILHHRALGYTANAMLVLDVADAEVVAVGRALAHETIVSLCYRRPRRLPMWPYNLFCMIHGRERGEVERQIEALLERHALRQTPHRWLFSLRAYKQCGGRYTAPPADLERRHG